MNKNISFSTSSNRLVIANQRIFTTWKTNLWGIQKYNLLVIIVHRFECLLNYSIGYHNILYGIQFVTGRQEVTYIELINN